MTTATHRNTDRGNADCYCPIWADHANLPLAERVTVLHILLRHHEVELVSDERGTLVVPVHIRDTQAVYRVLTAYGIGPRRHSTATEGHRGLYVAAEVFNR